MYLAGIAGTSPLSAGSDLISWFWVSQECIYWHEPLDCLVHEGETQLFTPLMESWEIMLVEETRQEPRCFGPIVPGCEVCCNLLDLL